MMLFTISIYSERNFDHQSLRGEVKPFHLSPDFRMKHESALKEGDYVLCLAFYLSHYNLIGHLLEHPHDKSVGTEIELSRSLLNIFRRLKKLLLDALDNPNDIIPHIIYVMVYIKRYLSHREQHLSDETKLPIENNLNHIVFFAFYCAQVWMDDEPVSETTMFHHAKFFFEPHDFYFQERIWDFLVIFDWDLFVSEEEYEQEQVYFDKLMTLLNIRQEYYQTGDTTPTSENS